MSRAGGGKNFQHKPPIRGTAHFDQRMPRNATDGFAPNFDFRPHKGGTEWVTHEFAKPEQVGSATVSRLM